MCLYDHRWKPLYYNNRLGVRGQLDGVYEFPRGMNDERYLVSKEVRQKESSHREYIRKFMFRVHVIIGLLFTIELFQYVLINILLFKNAIYKNLVYYVMPLHFHFGYKIALYT